MDNKFSRSWINMRIHYDNMARSGILTEFIDKNDLKQYLYADSVSDLKTKICKVIDERQR